MIPTAGKLRRWLHLTAVEEVVPRQPPRQAAIEEVEPPPAPELAVAPPHMPQAGSSAEATRLARVQARLHTPGALRDAIVVKEILDRPLALRRGRNS